MTVVKDAEWALRCCASTPLLHVSHMWQDGLLSEEAAYLALDALWAVWHEYPDYRERCAEAALLLSEGWRPGRPLYQVNQFAIRTGHGAQRDAATGPGLSCLHETAGPVASISAAERGHGARRDSATGSGFLPSETAPFAAPISKGDCDE